MKLVDILARELKEWPYAIDSIYTGSAAALTILNGRQVDHPEHVTKSEWQIVVDSLKAKANEVPIWTGEGLPPVGVACEIRHSGWAYGHWQAATIKYISSEYLIVGEGSFKREQHFHMPDIEFRPIRTPEQIAAEERTDNAIAMCQATQGAKDWMEAFRMLHDAGYRKFEIVENEE
jgi:hypothetical protein